MFDSRPLDLDRLVPSFYLITGRVKGESLSQSLTALREQWLTASFGTAVIW